ncbi:MAG: SDR family oxidoreductase [Isosphaeraceae bacterium]
MTTLIVGCGYLGERLGIRLVRDGGRVFGTVRSPARAEAIARSGIEPVVADVLRPETLAALPAVDRVFYAVGFDRSAGAAMREVYVDGLQAVLDRLPDSADRFVYAGSTGVYGQSGGEWVDEDSPTSPEHESGRVVLEAEARIRAWAGSRRVSAVILRFAGLYGPGRIVRRALLERGEPIPGDPDKFLNLVHIDDAAAVAEAALDRQNPAPVYLVADDRPVTRREYYATAARVIGAPEPRFDRPRPGSVEATRDATNKRVDNRRMKANLGVVLRYPDITTGLAAALDDAGPPTRPPTPTQPGAGST